MVMRLAGKPRSEAYAMKLSGGCQSDGRREPRLAEEFERLRWRLASAMATARTIAPCSSPSASIDRTMDAIGVDESIVG